MRAPEPAFDQAAGLRRLFAPAAAEYVPVAARRGVTAPLVANLAWACARIGRSVLVIDQTPGEVANALGLAARRELAHVIAGDSRLEHALLRADDALAVLPAHRGLGLAVGRGRTLPQVLERVLHRFGLVLVHADSAQLAGALAPGAADLLLPIAAAADSLADAYGEVKRSARRGARVCALVHGVATPRAAQALFDALSATAAQFLDARPSYAGFVPSDPALYRAVATCRSIFDVDPTSPAARALERVAAALGERPPAVVH
jgi:MinD-like ATPase involved in chromosome partitioning or flagellar assembly